MVARLIKVVPVTASAYFLNLSGDCLIKELPGEHTGGETPDPIPNSEAKPVQADGSRFAARVGHRQDLYPDRRENAYRDSFFGVPTRAKQPVRKRSV